MTPKNLPEVITRYAGNSEHKSNPILTEFTINGKPARARDFLTPENQFKNINMLMTHYNITADHFKQIRQRLMRENRHQDDPPNT
jgi:hypothetical protein